MKYTPLTFSTVHKWVMHVVLMSGLTRFKAPIPKEMFFGNIIDMPGPPEPGKNLINCRSKRLWGVKDKIFNMSRA